MSTEPETHQPEAGKRRGIYILPNLFTTGSLFSGFYAIIAAMDHHYIPAVIAIFVALIFDGLDGRVARLINAQSPFGAEYDSLSDLVSFGTAPALVLYNWALQPLQHEGFGHLGWLVAFLFVTCVALRLARFNTQLDHSGAKRYFIGLPCPAAAVMMASIVWMGAHYQWSGEWVSVTTAVITAGVALLMVSNIRFRSFKDIDLRGKMRFAALVLMIVIVVAIAISPLHVLFTLFALYVLSGPVLGLWRVISGQHKKDRVGG